MFTLSTALLGAALLYEAGNVGIGMLVMGVISYGVMYSPWYGTPDHIAPTPGLLAFAVVVWFCVGFGVLYGVLISYDIFMVLGFVVLALPAYRSLRSAMRAPAALHPI